RELHGRFDLNFLGDGLLQGGDEGEAARIALIGVLAQGLEQYLFFGIGEGVEVGGVVKVVLHQAGQASAVVNAPSQAQLDIGGSQAVLVAVQADLVVPNLRRHVQGRAGAAARYQSAGALRPGQAEVREAGVALGEQNV